MKERDTGRRKLPLLRVIQIRTARVAVGASATRGQGPGVVRAAREFFSKIKLAPFATSDRRLFARRLEAATRRLQGALPRRAASWGIARKLLNIFVRDCLYNTYLTKAYQLAKAERVMEIPLDSITATILREEMPELPRWYGVKHLTPEVSFAYQTAAQLLAERRGVARVHLDADWWGARK